MPLTTSVSTRAKTLFLFRFPEDTDTGFPYIYLFKDGKATEVTGFEALGIIRLLVKD